MKTPKTFLNNYIKEITVFLILSIIYYIWFPYDFLYNYKSIFYEYGEKSISYDYYIFKFIRSIVFVTFSFIPYFILQISYSIYLKLKHRSNFKLVKLNTLFLIVPIIFYSLSFYGFHTTKNEHLESINEFNKSIYKPEK